MATKIGQGPGMFGHHSKMNPVTTKNTNNGLETIGVEIGFGPLNLDKLNMDGTSPVRVVRR